MNMEHLLEKYFEGTTTCAEERQLRDFFLHGDVPEEWADYRPIFVCMQEEIDGRRAAAADPVCEARSAGGRHKLSRFRRLALWSTGMAAALAVGFLLGRSGWMTSAEAENYVVINGVYSDDERLVREKAMEALENVSFDEEELRDMLASPL